VPPIIRRPDGWRWLLLPLWVLFFGAGLFPEWIFYALRGLSGVSERHAMINNYHLLSFSLTAYLVAFTLQRCRDAGLDDMEARGKALQVGVFALIAFLPVRLDQWTEYFHIGNPQLRRLVFSAIAVKSVMWLYLFFVVLRYYLVSGTRVFIDMPALLPSLRHRAGAPPAPENACPDPSPAADAGHDAMSDVPPHAEEPPPL
jgi:hypothetical protein